MKIIKEAKSSKYDGMFWSEFFNEYQEDGNKLPKKLKSVIFNVRLENGSYLAGKQNNVNVNYFKDSIEIGGLIWFGL